MERNYSNIAFDPTSAHYVGAATIPTPFQAYDEEGEIQMGPTGEQFDYTQREKNVVSERDANEAGDNLIPPLNERSTLELFSQGSDPWRVMDG